MTAPIDLLQNPVDVGIQLNVKEKSVGGVCCGFIGDDSHLYRTRIVTTTWETGGPLVVTTSLTDRAAIAVEQGSGDSCAYTTETTGSSGLGTSHTDTTYEDEITVADLQAWADSLLEGKDFTDLSGPVDLPLGGTKGWNGLTPVDFSGITTEVSLQYTSINEIDTATVLVTRSQIGWAVTKSHVPYLISWDEVTFTHDPITGANTATSRTNQTQQMGEGTWNTGFVDWTPASNTDKQIQNARFNLPWFPP